MQQNSENIIESISGVEKIEEGKDSENLGLSFYQKAKDSLNQASSNVRTSQFGKNTI